MKISKIIEKTVLAQDYIISDDWKVFDRIGYGTFGEVYRALSMDHSQQAAAKIELVEANTNSLKRELVAYHLLKNTEGFPKLFWHEIDAKGKALNILVIQLLGPNLSDLLYLCNGKFSLKTTLGLFDQLITRIELMHSKGLLHRDIKPRNIVIGVRSEQDMAFLIDFGLANLYRYPETNEHIPKETNVGIIGTPVYASLNAINGITQSRRDDLEALGYTLIHLFKGHLPWSELKSDKKSSKRDKIIEMRKTFTIKKLCQKLPEEFRKFMEYCQELEFDQTPDYEFCRQIFRNLYSQVKCKSKLPFDWSIRRR